MNLPNKLSLFRIILIPFVIFFYLANFIPYGKIIAIAIFIIAALTDLLDGKIARKYNLVTNLGKLLDPIADKLLVVSSLLLVVCDGTIPSPYGLIVAIIIIARELFISGFRQIAATKNFVMAADMFGKIKTVVQDLAIPALILTAFFIQIGLSSTIILVAEIISWSLIGIACVLTILSGINYVVKNKEVLKG